MSRSGYSDDCSTAELNLWRGTVERSIRGRRGQALLRAMRDALDAMPVKELIAEELVFEGQVCAMGAVAAAQGIDLSEIDPEDRHAVAKALNIAPALAAEIAWVNDDAAYDKDDVARWVRVRNWVQQQIVEGGD